MNPTPDIIDIHAHAFPDALAARIIEPMAKEAGVPAAHAGTVSSLKDSMRCAGIGLSVLMPVATKPDQVASVNRWAIAQNSDGDEVLSFGALHPQQEDAVAEVERLAAAGVKGVKFHPDYQQFRPDDPVMFPAYEAMAERGMIVLFHCGKDLSTPPPVMGTPERIYAVHELFGTLRIIGAHFGGYEMWDDVRDRHAVGGPGAGGGGPQAAGPQRGRASRGVLAERGAAPWAGGVDRLSHAPS
jgi:predicted TIM-barrel fold metal-dependent hydrolase